MLLKIGTTNSLLALILTFGLGMAPAANAQEAGAPPQAPQGQQPPVDADTADLSQENLEKFANVNVKAREIETKYKPEVDAAKTMDDVEAVQQKMNGELIGAIESEDISVEEYQQVAMALQNDPGLREKVITMISEKVEENGNQ